MLFLPKGGLPPKKNKMGYARGHGPSGHWLRARASVVNPNTDAMNRWRHVFTTAKQNYASLVANATVPPLSYGWEATAIWNLINTYYNGVLQPGPYENGIIGIGSQIACVDGEAYFQMVQANAASLGQAALPAPALITVGGNIVPAVPPPVFAVPSSMSCSTLYDLSFNVIGFELTYKYIGGWTYPASPRTATPTGWGPASGGNAPGVWEILASDAYTSSYSPPAASLWQPILFSGPNVPLPAGVLAAWQDQFGALPPSGNIKFQMCYIDPVTCASGPALSATAVWKQGTLIGADKAVFTGPKFIATNNDPGQFNGSVAGVEIQLNIQGANGYAGTISFTGKNTYYLPTGTPPGTKSLPVGTVITVTPPTLTIASGDTSTYLILANFVFPASTPNYELRLKIEAEDGIQTGSAANIIQLTHGTGLLLNSNYLTMDIATPNPAPPSPGQAAVVITLLNTGPNIISGEMLAASKNTTLGLEYAAVAAAAASTQPTYSPTPGFASPAVPSSTTYGTQTISMPNASVAIGVSQNTDVPITTTPGGVAVYYAGVSPAVTGVTYAVLPGFGGDVTGVNVAVDVSTVPGIYTQTIQLLDQYDNPLGGLLTIKLTVCAVAGYTLKYALPNSAGTNGLIGQKLSSLGYAPAGYNVTDATIIASDNTSATVGASANPGAMTTEGQAGLVAASFTVPPGTQSVPGTATSTLLITVPAGLDTYGIQIQVQAWAGNNTNNYTLTLT